jgi:hypothetical protein
MMPRSGPREHRSRQMKVLFMSTQAAHVSSPTVRQLMTEPRGPK